MKQSLYRPHGYPAHGDAECSGYSRIKSQVSRGAIVVGFSSALAFFAPVAQAHDSVIGGTITQDEVVDEFPEKITLEFSGIPRQGFNTFAISNKDSGEVLFSQEPDADERFLSIVTPDNQNLGDGNYMLGFQITSSDGHATRGGLSFTVASETEASTTGDFTTPTVDELDEEEKSNPLLWLLAGAGVLVIIAVAAVMIAKRRGLRAE